MIASNVLRHAMLPVTLGLCAGLAAAIAGGRAIRGLLFDVSPVDLITLVSVSVVLLTVGLIACYLPARRARRVDPLTALRTE